MAKKQKSNIKNVISPTVESRCKKNNRKGILTVVSKSCSSYCVIFSNELAESLELEDRVTVGFLKDEKKILLGKQIPGINHDGYVLKNRISNGKAIKRIIYSTSLVRDIVEIFGMDFTEKTTETFYTLELQEEDGCLIAVIGR